MLHSSWTLQAIVPTARGCDGAVDGGGPQAAAVAAAAASSDGASTSLLGMFLEWDRIVRPGGAVALCVPNHADVVDPLIVCAARMWWAQVADWEHSCVVPAGKLQRFWSGAPKLPAESKSQWKGGGRLMVYTTPPPNL